MIEVKFKEGVAKLDSKSGKWFFFKEVPSRTPGKPRLVSRPMPYRVKRVLNINE